MSNPPEINPSTPLTEAFERIADILTKGRIPYAIIGGFAVAYRGIARPTRDVDVLFSAPRIVLPSLFEKFRERGFSFDLTRVLGDLGENHLSTIQYGTVLVDLLDACIPFFQQALGRAQEVETMGGKVRIVTAEDLIVLKMLAAREDDLRDVRGILRVQKDRLDLESVRRLLETCCSPQQVSAFEGLVADSSGA